MENQILKIGIMGKAGRSKDLPKLLSKKAKIIGREIAKNEHILITGACMGIPHITALACSEAGGLVLGYSPSKDIKEHIEPPISYPRGVKNMVHIFTGYGKIGRNVLSIFECDGIICVGGGIGTLNEFSIAYHEGKVIGVLLGSDGIIEEIIEHKEYFRDTGAIVIKDRDPKRLVKSVIAEIEKRKKEPRKEIPITFTNKQNKQLMGVVHLPKKNKPPAVIICHGFQRTKTVDNYVAIARKLRDKGILAFRFDFEGCGDSEGDPRNITIKNQVSDLYYAFKALKKECDIDGSNIAFIGDSISSVVLVNFLNRYKIKTQSLVLWAPAFNQKALFKLWFNKEDIRRIRKNGYVEKGSKKIGRAYFNENKDKDYTSILKEIKFPILIIHGKEDEDVPLEYSQNICKRYKKISLEVILGGNHKLEGSTVQEKLHLKTIKWIKKYLIF
jgi:uncharacterized protein (TIGR00725 family)